ncbi:oxidative stress-responsive serine-rich protein 1 isoform 2-T2 [Aulostomus maculatus]
MRDVSCSVPGVASVSDMAPRVASRACLDPGGVKPKLSCQKDNWHGCTRKTSRGASRTQRRRRSKSPILHPPKFTYCSVTTLSPPSVCLKHQRLAVPEPAESHATADGRPGASLPVTAQKGLCSSGSLAHISPAVFGSSDGHETFSRAAVSSSCSQETPVLVSRAVTSSQQDAGGSVDIWSSKEGHPEKSDGAADDFRALSQRHSSGAAEGPLVPCTCAPRSCQDGSTQGPECGCQSHHQRWNSVEVYSFTGLRHVISECERSLPSCGDAPRTPNTTATTTPVLASGSPRSCSEQARAYVDDITIEDLSGYMEYYLYIPKKMSHMAEMMYT